jgi:hypothetical protein
MDYKPVLMDSKPWQESVGWKKNNIMKGVYAVIIIALIAVGIGFYTHAKMKRQYAETYVMALYGIKMGTDLGLKVCSKVSDDWTSKNSSGQNVPPQVTTDDIDQLNKIKIKTDKYLQKLNDPPSTFTEANVRLRKLNELFLKLHAAALTPTGTVATYATLTKNTENDFISATAELQKNLPAEISEELKIAKAKYRGLKNI